MKRILTYLLWLIKYICTEYISIWLKRNKKTQKSTYWECASWPLYLWILIHRLIVTLYRYSQWVFFWKSEFEFIYFITNKSRGGNLITLLHLVLTQRVRMSSNTYSTPNCLVESKLPPDGSLFEMWGVQKHPQ